MNKIREEDISEETYKRFKKEIEEKGYIDNWKNGKLYKINPYSPPRDWFDINTVPQENNIYSTQKPKKLLERIIKASSNKGDIVADFYMGSGTTAEVCFDLDRNFIGCDISEKAVNIAKKRIPSFKEFNLFD